MDGGDAIYQNIKINEFFKKAQYPLKKINPISIRAPFQGSWLALCAVTYIYAGIKRERVFLSFCPAFVSVLRTRNLLLGAPALELLTLFLIT